MPGVGKKHARESRRVQNCHARVLAHPRLALRGQMRRMLATKDFIAASIRRQARIRLLRIRFRRYLVLSEGLNGKHWRRGDTHPRTKLAHRPVTTRSPASYTGRNPI